MTPAVDTAKKGIDGGGPVTEAEIELSLYSLRIYGGLFTYVAVDSEREPRPVDQRLDGNAFGKFL